MSPVSHNSSDIKIRKVMQVGGHCLAANLQLQVLRFEVPLKDDTGLLLTVVVPPQASTKLPHLFQHFLEMRRHKGIV